MTKWLILAIIISIVMLSCDEIPFIYVEKSVSGNKTLVYNINTAGGINETAFVGVISIVNELSANKDGQLQKKDYTIKELSIQSANFEVIANQGNLSNTLYISSVVVKPAYTAAPIPFMQETSIPIGLTSIVPQSANLLFPGVDAINKSLAAAVKNRDDNTVWSVDIRGRGTPLNSRINITVKLKIVFNLVYSYCEESLFVIDGPKCGK
ncbi:hypothetical protein [Emticicia sp. BO119]|uniref:hypothetical protein n=1 Tax=Emticicia sp. BO119 TaxID=2757768 RepID=UPI0015EFE594|nr:hypothetical protein [Emticicia sp. BO119]MBA4849628.1 hypothetical protein [Emticicia sp. BO119]